MVLRGLRIGVMMSGGIAAYKVTELVRQLIKKGAQVRVMMTASATQFISPLTMQVLSRANVIVDTFDENEAEHVQHIHYADWCDLVVLAPATANIIGKLANGIADEVVSTTLLAVTCPKLIVPAMNSHMYDHPAVQRNIEVLIQDGNHIMEPDTGFLAEGYEGKGRLPDIEAIVIQIESIAASIVYPQVLQDQKIIVTTGGTIERVDPVRYISNDSSGKMGFAMARFAAWLGAEVELITSKGNFPSLPNVNTHLVESASEMYEKVLFFYEDTDYVVMSAAVSDYRAASPADQKLKKNDQTSQKVVWELVENPDILANLGQKKDKQVLIGFAAETQEIMKYAHDKLERKNADWIVANDVSEAGIGFNSDHNQVTIIGRDGRIEKLPVMDKLVLAGRIWSIVTNQEIDSE